MSKVITKYFKTRKQAERFQNSLYDKYDSVQLVRAPTFAEEGSYVWRVEDTTQTKVQELY